MLTLSIYNYNQTNRMKETQNIVHFDVDLSVNVDKYLYFN